MNGNPNLAIEVRCLLEEVNKALLVASVILLDGRDVAVDILIGRWTVELELWYK